MYIHIYIYIYIYIWFCAACESNECQKGGLQFAKLFWVSAFAVGVNTIWSAQMFDINRFFGSLSPPAPTLLESGHPSRVGPSNCMHSISSTVLATFAGPPPIHLSEQQKQMIALHWKVKLKMWKHVCFNHCSMRTLYYSLPH